MKKVFLIMSSMSIMLFSCEVKKADTPNDDARERNLTAISEINKAIETGDVSKLDQYIASNAVDHASPAGDIQGVDSIKSMLSKIHTMGTNMKMQDIRTVADGDYVFQWMRLTGTTASTDMGMPSGVNYDINAVQVTRFADGKVVEHWEFLQPADMAKMMGTQSLEPSLQNTSDTTENN